MTSCSLCHDTGWVIEAKVKADGITTLEIIPCLIPDCSYSGRKVELVSLDMMKMHRANFHPKEHFIMSVSKGD